VEQLGRQLARFGGEAHLREVNNCDDLAKCRHRHQRSDSPDQALRNPPRMRKTRRKVGRSRLQRLEGDEVMLSVTDTGTSILPKTCPSCRRALQSDRSHPHVGWSRTRSIHCKPSPRSRRRCRSEVPQEADRLSIHLQQRLTGQTLATWVANLLSPCFHTFAASLPQPRSLRTKGCQPRRSSSLWVFTVFSCLP
jgi:hypothetical protein